MKVKPILAVAASTVALIVTNSPAGSAVDCAGTNGTNQAGTAGTNTSCGCASSATPSATCDGACTTSDCPTCGCSGAVAQNASAAYTPVVVYLPASTTACSCSAPCQCAGNGASPCADTTQTANQVVSDSLTGQNQAPVAGTVAISPEEVAPGLATFQATPANFTDADNDQLTYTYTWTINGVPVPNNNTATLTQQVNRGDVVKVSVTASDNHGGTSGAATDWLTVGNRAPLVGTVAISPEEVTAGSVTFTATPTDFTDADNDKLTYTYTWTVNGKTVANTTTGSLIREVTRGDVVKVSVTASDNHGGTSGAATDSVTVGNKAPVAGTAAISPEEVAPGLATFKVTSAGFTDADNDKLTYTYTWTINGAQVTNNTSSLTREVNDRDLVEVSVTAADNHGGTSGAATDSLTVGNKAPVAGSVAISPDEVTAGSVTFTATPTGFTDANNDKLTYTYIWTVNGKTVANTTTGSLTWQVTRGDVVKVSVTASDNYGGTSGAATDSVTVANTAPKAGTVSISPKEVSEGLVTFKATPAGFTDADNDKLTYTYIWTINGAAVTNTTSSLTREVTDRDLVEVSVTATDNHGGTSGAATDSVFVGNTAPKAGSVSISPDQVTEGLATFKAVPNGFTDVDNDKLTYLYTWTVNGEEVPDNTTASLTQQVAPGDVVEVSATAADNYGGISAAATDSVTVDEAASASGTDDVSDSASQDSSYDHSSSGADESTAEEDTLPQTGTEATAGILGLGLFMTAGGFAFLRRRKR